MSEPSAPSPSGDFRADDRAHSAPGELSRPFVGGAGILLVAAAGLAVFAPGSQLESARATDSRQVLSTITVLCGVAVFGLSRLTWRQIGDPVALWAGLGALTLSVAAAARPELVQSLLGGEVPGARSLAAVSDAALAVTPVLFAAGLVPRFQRRSFRPAALVAGATIALVALALVAYMVPNLGPSLVISQVTRGDGAGTVFAGLVVVGVWLGLAVGYTVRGLRRRWLYSWAGLLLFATTLAGLAAGAARADNAWAVGAALLETLGLVVALVGCQVELARVYEDQTLKLFDSTLDAETAEVRERVRDATQRDRRHDLANAITAIDGAVMILEGELERLSGEDRETLGRVVASGTARLRLLLIQEGDGKGEVSMAETAAAVSDSNWGGGKLELDVTPDLLGSGSPGETTEALRQLVDYAYRRAPGSPLTVRGERDGQWVVLRVEDCGPTMSREQRRTILDVQSHRASAPADTIGLRVATRLMRGQGGDLWIEAREGGGTSFGICLPAVGAGDD